MPKVKNKEIRTYFYSVALPQGITSDQFRTFFDSLYSGGEDRRVFPIESTKHLLLPLKKQDGYYFALAKEREGGWPYIIGDDASVKPVNLSKGTLGELTVYWLSSDTGVLAEAYNHFSPRPTTLKAFFIQAAKRQSIKLKDIDFYHLLIERAYSEFARLTYHKKLIYKIANPDPKFLDELMSDNDLKNNLAILQSGKALAIEVVLSVGHSSKMLDFNFVKKVVDKMRNRLGVKKLRAKGGDDDSKPREINLLDDRLNYKETKEITGRYVSFSDYMDVLNKGIEHHREYLRQLNPSFHNQ